MKYVCALFTVRDIAVAKDFYVRVLKQKVEIDFGVNVGFEGGFALHEREHFRALIGDRDIAVGGNCGELYFEEEDLERIEAELKKEKVEFIHGLREQAWRQRVLRFYDPDRHIVEIGEPMDLLCSRLAKEGLGAAEIGRATGLAADFVERALNGKG